MTISKRQRIKLRSRKYNDMKPHVFDKLLALLPHVMDGISIPNHYES